MLTLALLMSCQQQYLVISDTQVIAGTPQYAYSDVWVGSVTPTFAVADGSLDLVADGDPVALEIDFSAPYDFEVTELVFFGLETGDTEFGDHWLYRLVPDEIAAGTAVITMKVVTQKPAKAGCSVEHVGTWVCFQGARLGVDGLGLSAAGSDAVSLYSEVPLTLPPLVERPSSDACSGYTIDDCCAGSPGIAVVECAWDPSCDCPSGTDDLGLWSDGYRHCDCPG